MSLRQSFDTRPVVSDSLPAPLLSRSSSKCLIRMPLARNSAPSAFIRARALSPPLSIRITPLRSTTSLRFDSGGRSEEHTSELQSLTNLVCRLLLEKKKKSTYDEAEGWSKLKRTI